MMQVSYSKMKCWLDCAHQYKLKYIDKLVAKDDLSPTNAFYIGTAVHEGIEKGSVEAAIESYKSNYPSLDSENEVEIEKLKVIVPIAIESIPKGEYELELNSDDFKGFIDCLVKVEDGLYDIMDFKCSNNVSEYLRSSQVHLYKYYFERLTGNKVRDLYYVFIPKARTKHSDGEDIKLYESKSLEEMKRKKIRIEKVEYDQKKVDLFLEQKRLLEKATEFPKEESWRCNWCPFKKYCQSNGEDKSELKENE